MTKWCLLSILNKLFRCFGPVLSHSLRKGIAMAAKDVGYGELIVQPELDFAEIFTSPARTYVHNFDGDERMQWSRMSRAQGSTVEALSDHLGEEIPVRYVIAHRVGIRSAADGSMIPGVRSVLVSPNGDMFDTVSTQIANRVGEMLRLFAGKPFDPPLIVKAVEVKARSGFRVLTLEAVN